MIPINEYIDTLINAKRYDICNEGLFGNRNKTKEKKYLDSGAKIDNCSVMFSILTNDIRICRSHAAYLNNNITALKALIAKETIARLIYTRDKVNNTYTNKAKTSLERLLNKYKTTADMGKDIKFSFIEWFQNEDDHISAFYITFDMNPSLIDTVTCRAVIFIDYTTGKFENDRPIYAILLDDKEGKSIYSK